MLDEFDFGSGFPEWTELGQEAGLDPLGMQRPIEVIYQSLLPGISTITLRLESSPFKTWNTAHLDHKRNSGHSCKAQLMATVSPD